jgi:DNA-binding transcriptional regulator YhcF (GntR family)
MPSRDLSDQLRDRLVSGLHAGRYRGGERLPPVRALAREFGVNERGVLAALRVLADEGFVELRARSGAYVATPHPASGEVLPHLGAWLVETLLDARARGIPPRTFGQYVRRCLETRRLHAACVECNDDQLHMLCSELANDHGLATRSVPVEELDGAPPSSALVGADLLVTTMFHVAEVRRAAERLGKPWIAVALRAAVIDEVVRRLEREPVYYVVSDPRFEPKLHRMLGTEANLDNLRFLVVGRDDVDAIPPDAATFVMSSVRDQMTARYGERNGPGIPLHPPRQISDDSARDILRFVVRANLASLSAGLG